MEKALFRPSPEHATPQGVAAFFAEVFAALDANPRGVEVEIDFSEASPDCPVALDIERGEPVFRQQGGEEAHGRLGGRWLAEHNVPLALSAKASRFVLEPTDGNRIKVRTRGYAEYVV